MKAILGLYRRLGHLALLERLDRLDERLGQIAAVGPVELAALDLAAGIFRFLLGHVFEFGALGEHRHHRLGVGLFLDQDVARLVFLAVGIEVLGLDLLVFFLQIFIGRLVVLEVVLQIGGHQYLLAGEVDLGLVVDALVEADLDGFLADDLAGDQRLA